ncbi:glycoside hydrolase family 5 protein [Aaosphaeria arxii CBS 175.79]|uniref:Glycoside hydrolase family 5 protein n=1 Tax=Aaosphaeria arxii CBS 175.79 TaxID=1450172 RepID=A0A6A5XRM6_9PLEO|nr:glycoside hydrolase family 5 protein [Aaosphaeria arxii CBS 175.79]KAF2015340.1 glycoside hydrolase family 5 protein [Aaosphaeria arxii CBS 175.79]
MVKILGATTCSFLAFASIASAQLQPLHTSSRWILDSSNKRFKLKCINWAGHMEANIPEGLHHSTPESIARVVADSGFNCVRLTFSIDMALNQGQKVSDSFSTLASRSGADPAAVSSLWTKVQEKNNWISTATVGDVFGRVIDSLGALNVRVILDNHVSKASWCCNLEDGNGWWDEGSLYIQANSRFFKTQDWYKGLAAIATFSKAHPAVAGVGLRNEIREVPVLQNRDAWYKFVTNGARAVHDANKDLLITVGGTLSSTDASFLRSKPLDRAPFGDKVVWEWHQYTFSPPWIASFKSCGVWKTTVGGFTGFLLEQDKAFTGPLWLSEFGAALSGGPPERSGIGTQEDYDYLKCMVEYAVGNDGDWALWALQANYYVRDGVVDKEEGWGLLNAEWTAWRNPAVREVIGKLFETTQGPR